jgi:hypothetical protein
MDEPEPTADVISEHQAANLVVQLARALDQATELLEAATELHRRVAELHGALAEPLLDLERLLTEARTQTPEEHE